MEEFEILEISYDYLTGDVFSAAPTIVEKRTLINDTDIPANRSITLTGTTTNTSKFSKTHRISVTATSSSTIKTGIPIFAEGEMTLSVTNTNEWTYATERTTSKTQTITEVFSQDIPPRTTVTASIVGIEYRADITYYAKVRGKTTGQILYLPGRWEGVIIQETEIRLIQSDGTLLRTVSLNK